MVVVLHCLHISAATVLSQEAEPALALSAACGPGHKFGYTVCVGWKAGVVVKHANNSGCAGCRRCNSHGLVVGSSNRTVQEPCKSTTLNCYTQRTFVVERHHVAQCDPYRPVKPALLWYTKPTAVPCQLITTTLPALGGRTTKGCTHAPLHANTQLLL